MDEKNNIDNILGVAGGERALIIKMDPMDVLKLFGAIFVAFFLAYLAAEALIRA